MSEVESVRLKARAQGRNDTYGVVGVVLILLLSGQPARADSPLAKPLVEQRGHILVWDHGAHPGFADSTDSLIDFDVECDEDTTSAMVPSILRKKPVANISAAQTKISSVLTALRLNSLRFTSTLVDAFVGEKGKPIFLILPEHHLQYDKSENNLRLHEAVTNELAQITNHLLQNHFSIFNAIEGPRGSWRSTLNLHGLSPEQREKMAKSIVREKDLAGGDAIGELYADAIPTAHVESLGYGERWAIASMTKELRTSHDYVSGRDYFPLIENWFKENKSESLIETYDLKTYYNHLMSKPLGELKGIETALCEERSEAMVTNTFEEIGPRKPDVVYLTIGLLHLHGVLKKLKESGASYLILSPN